jgi:hypothetical protein
MSREPSLGVEPDTTAVHRQTRPSSSRCHDAAVTEDSGQFVCQECFEVFALRAVDKVL